MVSLEIVSTTESQITQYTASFNFNHRLAILVCTESSADLSRRSLFEYVKLPFVWKPQGGNWTRRYKNSDKITSQVVISYLSVELFLLSSSADKVKE